MSERIRYHLDESVSSAIAEGLRRRGVDVTTTPEEGLMSVSDEEQLNYAASQGRVLVSHDDDFLALHAKGIQHADCHQRERTIGDIIRALMLLWDCMDAEEMVNHVEFL